MKKYAAAAVICAFSVLPLHAGADPSTLVNRVIVNQALQQQLQNQLNAQQAQLEAQQAQQRLALQTQMLTQRFTLQNIMLEQQLELLKLQQRALGHAAAHHKVRRHS